MASAVAGQGLQHVVELRGRLTRPQVRAAYADADVFLAPAELEAFGIAALEARTAGLAIVARRGTGIAEFVEDGVDGLLVADDAEMTEAIVHLARDGRLLEGMLTHNRAVRPAFGWDDVLGAAESEYARARSARSPDTSADSPGFSPRVARRWAIQSWAARPTGSGVSDPSCWGFGRGDMTTTTGSPKTVRVLGLITIIFGIIFIIAGGVTWGAVSSNLAAEKITVSDDAQAFGGQLVDTPWEAWFQADIINTHALEASGGKTYAELPQDDPTRQTVMTASFLRASLFTSVVAFGVALLVVGIGVVFILIGWALRKAVAPLAVSRDRRRPPRRRALPGPDPGGRVRRRRRRRRPRRHRCRRPRGPTA